MERDLLHAPDDVSGATRERVATERSGAQILALQGPDGNWAEGAFFPTGFDFDGPEAGEASKWLTFYATRVLQWWDSARVV